MLKYIDVSSRYVGRLAIRIAKRIFLLLIGFAVTFVIAWEVFPTLNNNLPVLSAILITYVISAYIIIPSGIRIIRLWYRPNHIPHFVTTPDGFNGDPVNIGLVGTKHQIRTAMRKAGWYEADKKTVHSVLKMVYSLILRKPYPNAPFSALYLFGRKQDIGFQKHVPGSMMSRHHVRFWACTASVNSKFVDHVHFWQKKLDPSMSSKLLWVGAAIKDEGLGLIKYHGQVTHSVDSDTNAERNYIVEALQKNELIKQVIIIKAGEETKISNRVIGNHMISDGELHICILK